MNSYRGLEGSKLPSATYKSDTGISPKNQYHNIQSNTADNSYKPDEGHETDTDQTLSILDGYFTTQLPVPSKSIADPETDLPIPPPKVDTVYYENLSGQGSLTSHAIQRHAPTNGISSNTQILDHGVGSGYGHISDASIGASHESNGSQNDISISKNPSESDLVSNQSLKSTDTDNSPTNKLTWLAKNIKSKTAAAAKIAAEKTAEFGSIAYERGSEWGTRAKQAANAASSNMATRRKETDHSLHKTEYTVPEFPIFGASLFDAVLRCRSGGNPYHDVPNIVFRCIEYLDARGIEEVGIYRLSGSTTEIQQLSQKFNNGDDVNLMELCPDPNAVASLFKSYIRKLPEPLLTNELMDHFAAPFTRFTQEDALFPPHLTATDEHPITSDQKTLESVSVVLRRLPLANYTVLSLLFSHLYRVSSRHATNKMTISNLQVVWTPTLGFNGSLFGTLLVQHERLFPPRTVGSTISSPSTLSFELKDFKSGGVSSAVLPSLALPVQPAQTTVNFPMRKSSQQLTPFLSSGLQNNTCTNNTTPLIQPRSASYACPLSKTASTSSSTTFTVHSSDRRTPSPERRPPPIPATSSSTVYKRISSELAHSNNSYENPFDEIYGDSLATHLAQLGSLSAHSNAQSESDDSRTDAMSNGFAAVAPTPPAKPPRGNRLATVFDDHISHASYSSSHYKEDI
ncbi:hypothetical protein BDV3_005534 [Batrachochytrium dendrobatidis]|nr:hypothetical protein O5D80_003632 [Batrachochytrium dendrobatidis]